MRGRIYDANIGRFMQADPHIQAPNNSQNYNRYSYVMNNPMSYTDPSGYFFKALGKLYSKYWNGTVGALLRGVAKVPILNTLAQIGACTFGGHAGCAIFAGVSAYAVTGSLGAGLKTAGISFASGLVFKEIGKSFQGTSGGFFDAGVKNGFRHIAAHAITGGVVAVLQGGKFGHGFFSAGITKGLTPQFGGIGGAGFELNGYNVAEAAIAGALGGTISKLTGGKFANGAVTAAMGNLFNEQSSRMKREEAIRAQTYSMKR